MRAIISGRKLTASVHSETVCPGRSQFSLSIGGLVTTTVVRVSAAPSGARVAALGARFLVCFLQLNSVTG